MKRASFTEERIIGILRENEAGAKAGELVRKHGVSEGTIYARKAKFWGQVWGDEGVGCPAASRVGRRERQVEAAARGRDAGQGGPERPLSKNGRAPRDARRRRSDPEGFRDQRAAGLFDHEGGPQYGAVPVLSRAGYGVARASARAGDRAAAVRPVAHKRDKRRDSGRRWMKTQGQIRDEKASPPSSKEQG